MSEPIMKCKHGGEAPCSFCRVEAMETKTCLGLFAPCGKPGDPKYTLSDPRGKDTLAIYRCTACGEGTEALFERAADQGKMGALAEAVDKAQALAEKERS